MLSVFDFLMTLLIVGVMAWFIFTGINATQQAGFVIIGLSLIGGLVAWMSKVLLLGLSYSVIAIAENTAPEKEQLGSYNDLVKANRVQSKC